MCYIGSWLEWQGWEDCSATCGVGVRRRQRLCDNITHFSFGQTCDGNAEEVELCIGVPCEG